MKNLCLLAAAAGLLAGTAWAQSPPKNELTLGCYVVGTGGDATVSVFLLNPDMTNAPAGAQFVIEYDPNVIQFTTGMDQMTITDVKAGPIFSGAPLAAGNANDTTTGLTPAKMGDHLASIAVVGTNAVTGPGVFVTLHIHSKMGAMAGASTALTIPSGGLTLLSATGDQVQGTPVNGGAVIGSANVSGSPAAIGNGLVSMVTDDGMLHELTVVGGCAEAAGFPAKLGAGGTGTNGRPVLRNSLVYVLANNGKLFSADSMGKVTQVADIGAGVTQATPAIATAGTSTIAVIVDSNGGVHAVDAATGMSTTAAMVKGAGGSSPVILAGNQISIATSDNKILLLNPDLTVRQSIALPSTVTAPLFVSSAGVGYAGTMDGKLLRFNTGTGQLLDAIDTKVNASITSSPFPGDPGELYVVNSQGQLFIITGADGATPTVNPPLALANGVDANESPVVLTGASGQKTLYFGDAKGMVHLVNLANLAKPVDSPTALGSDPLSSPAVTGLGANDVAFFSTSTGSAYTVPLQ